MKQLFSIKGKHLHLIDEERMIFDIDGRYYDITGTCIPEEPGFIKRSQDYKDDDPWNDEEINDQGLEEPLLPESVEDLIYEIDDIFGKFGFKNKSGDYVIEPQYAYAHEFTCGLAAVNLNRTWYRTSEGKRFYENHYGYINHRGETVIQFMYDEAWPFNKYGVAVAETLSDTFLIDTTGQTIPGTENIAFEHYYSYDDRFLEFTDKKANFAYELGDDLPVGLYDTKERKVVLEPSIDSVIQYSEDEILVYVRDGEHGDSDFRQYYINSKGEDLYPWLTEQRFAQVELPNKDGIAIVAVSNYIELTGSPSSYFEHDGKKYERTFLYGLFSKDKQFLLPLEYNEIEELSTNVFACYKDGVISLVTI